MSQDQVQQPQIEECSESEKQAIEFIDQLKLEKQVQVNLEELSTPLKDEIEQALQAQNLLAQLSTMEVPADLAINTARRARRRKRDQAMLKNSWFDTLLSVAVLLLIVTVISLVSYYLNEHNAKQSVEQVTP